MPPKGNKSEPPSCSKCKEATEIANKWLNTADLLQKRMVLAEEEFAKKTEILRKNLHIYKSLYSDVNPRLQDALLEKALLEIEIKSCRAQEYNWRQKVKRIPDYTGIILLHRNDNIFLKEEINRTIQLLKTRILFFFNLFIFFYYLGNQGLKSSKKPAIELQDQSTQCIFEHVNTSTQTLLPSKSEFSTQCNIILANCEVETQTQAAANCEAGTQTLLPNKSDFSNQCDIKLANCEVSTQTKSVFSTELVEELNVELKTLRKEREEHLLRLHELRNEIEDLTTTQKQIGKLLNKNFIMKANAEPKLLKEDKPDDPGAITMDRGNELKMTGEKQSSDMKPEYIESLKEGLVTRVEQAKEDKPDDSGAITLDRGNELKMTGEKQSSEMQAEYIASLKEELVARVEQTEELVRGKFAQTAQLVLQIQQDVRLKESPNLDFMEVLDFHSQIEAVKRCVAQFSEIEKTLDEKYMQTALKHSQQIKAILEESELLASSNRQRNAELASISKTLTTNVKLKSDSPNLKDRKREIKLTNVFRAENSSKTPHHATSEPILVVKKPSSIGISWEKELKDSIHYSRLAEWSTKDYLSVTERKPYSEKMDEVEWQFQKNMNWRLAFRK
jgi:hypothetical protein